MHYLFNNFLLTGYIIKSVKFEVFLQKKPIYNYNYFLMIQKLEFYLDKIKKWTLNLSS